MALTPEDIAHHLSLLDFYREEAAQANDAVRVANERLRRYEQAIRNTKSILQAEGVDI